MIWEQHGGGRHMMTSDCEEERRHQSEQFVQQVCYEIITKKQDLEDDNARIITISTYFVTFAKGAYFPMIVDKMS